MNLKCLLYNILFCSGLGIDFKEVAHIEASRGAAAQGVTVKPTGCGFDPHSRR